MGPATAAGDGGSCRDARPRLGWAVSLVRLGWRGAYLLTRSGGQEFLTVSKLRVDFVRTSGALQGSSLGFGKGNFKALFEAIEREQELRGTL